MLRFDYTPQDCVRFHQAIEKVVVPAVQHLYEKRRRRLGVKTLRPWDLEVDPQSRPPLRPFQDVSQLEQGVAAIIQAIDPQLGAYFDIMRREGLLDLENRKGKAPGGYCTDFPASRRPFIFMNAVGIHDDVQTLLHEGGHSFHVFESAHLPYAQQKEVGLEFAEVASTSMEYLGAQFLTNPGGFYSPAEAARARIAHLEETLAFWPYMAVVDAFQHWVYENASEALDPSNCDQKWSELWRRFMIGVDWSDMEEEMATGWQRKLHILQSPFYYIEYGLAQLGAFQVWRNSLKDAPGAVAAYRRALSLGGSVALPDLYRAAGARLAFDELALKEAVDLALQTIHELEQIHA
jgi:oligoendopeptidase F